MGTDDVPSQVRVRTDGSNRYRYDAIMKASERFDCNKTRAIVLACDVAGNLFDNIEEALQHEAPTVARRRTGGDNLYTALPRRVRGTVRNSK